MGKPTKSKKSIIIALDGPLCPRCNRPMAIYEHKSFTEKQLRNACYYTRWYACLNGFCRTSLVMPEQFRVWNPKVVRQAAKKSKQEAVRLQQIIDQLKLPWE